MAFPRACAALAFTFASTAAWSCSCALIEAGQTERLQAMVDKADAVLHARVVRVAHPQEATVEVIEAYKDPRTTLRASDAPESACGTRFREGEEAIYFVFGGKVSLCGRLQPRVELQRALRDLAGRRP